MLPTHTSPSQTGEVVDRMTMEYPARSGSVFGSQCSTASYPDFPRVNSGTWPPLLGPEFQVQFSAGGAGASAKPASAAPLILATRAAYGTDVFAKVSVTVC